MSSMYSKSILEYMTVTALKTIAGQYGLPKSGKKAEIVDRILSHHEKNQKKNTDHALLLARGAAKRDEGFERVIRAYVNWTQVNQFSLSKQTGEVTFGKVHINEIRAAFADYDPSTSPLRNDRYVPVPESPLEVFLEMFFGKYGGEWHFFDDTDEDRLFSEDSEYNEEWFVEGLKHLWESEAPQWCASSYAIRD